MKTFVEPLQSLSGFEDMIKTAENKGLISITGCIDQQKPHLIYGFGDRKNKLIVTANEQRA